MIEMLIVLTVCLVSYLAYFLKDGVPQSLSATYYMLGKNGWLFQMLMFALSFGLLPVWSSVSEDSWMFLCFLSCGGLLLVGASPLFKLPLESEVHHYSAYVCGASIILWQILEGLWDWVLLSAVICLVGYIRYGKLTWWVECMLMLSLVGNLFRMLY